MSDLASLLTSATTLHEALARDKSHPSSELLEEAILKRKRLCTEMKAYMRELRKMRKAIRLDAERREAEVQEELDANLGMFSILEDDIVELNDARWSAIHAEREAGKPRSTNPDLA